MMIGGALFCRFLMNAFAKIRSLPLNSKAIILSGNSAGTNRSVHPYNYNRNKIIQD
jgi:hypothetical protein